MSHTVGQVKAINSCKLNWEIDYLDISRQHNRVIENWYASPELTTNNNVNVSCFMRIFADYISLRLIASAEIKAVVSLKMFNNKGEVVADQILDEHGSDNRSWGSCARFIPKDFVFNPLDDILSDDKLTIVFDITENDGIQPRLEAIDEYESLLSDDRFSDVSLISEGKTLRAHKCILAKRSSVFATMFNTDMIEKQKNTVEIDDVKYDVLVELLRFIYAGKVNDIVPIVDELAIAAEKYALAGLTKMCEKTMIKNLSLDNVIGCLQFADRLRMDKLREEAIELVLKNASVVSEKPEFDLLSDDIVRKVFRCLAKRNK